MKSTALNASGNKQKADEGNLNAFKMNC